MLNYRIGRGRKLLVSLCCIFCAPGLMVPQTSNSSPGGSYRVAGTVVSKVDGRLLGRTRVILRDTSAHDKFESLVTAEDGKFAFQNVPAGKYSLGGTKRG